MARIKNEDLIKLLQEHPPDMLIAVKGYDYDIYSLDFGLEEIPVETEEDSIYAYWNNEKGSKILVIK